MKRDNSYLLGNQHAANTGPNKTSFKKGHIPWNKGKKGIHLSPATEFKKGRTGLNPNTKKVGELTIRTDKGKKSRRWIKVEEPDKWIEYAKFIWIKNNGQIPKGYLIHHIDEDTLNDKIDNLALLTRKAHFEIHGIGKIGRDAQKKRGLNG